jgi:hypothetical protein
MIPVDLVARDVGRFVRGIFESNSGEFELRGLELVSASLGSMSVVGEAPSCMAQTPTD